ncbi:FGFR1 oncogene partner [Thalassophryne amazonica]|uniref:FGFR1 oncogene partner n=1 Tax=Thalassophryne amazonica TaxID=390379 RepID=UPI001471711A|nr:FGFR1 oncogene partner [Thalassophryne amazonica]
MSAAEDDTELRDLLTQNLEHSGVLNKLKAEMRAAVFLAMEEQDKVENKSPLVNENLKNCLNTREGRLVASLIIDFLQVYHLDFTLAVFQPEINSLNGLDSRDLVCKDLGLSDTEQKSPLLLELIRRSHHKDRAAMQAEGDRLSPVSKDLSPKQMANAKKKFDLFDKEHSGSVIKEELIGVFTTLLPTLNKNMLERFIADELRDVDQAFSKTVDFQVFLGLYKRLFAQCRSVVLQDSDVCQLPGMFDEEKISWLSNNKVGNGSGGSLAKGEEHQVSKPSATPCVALNRVLDLDLEVEDDLDDGDSFFDDPLPKPQKIYGWKVEASRARESPVGSTLTLEKSKGGGTGTASSTSELSHSRNGTSKPRDTKPVDNKSGSLLLDDDVEYKADFNSHGSDLSKSELSISEEIKEVSIEGPENSTKFDETTQDVSVSQLSQSHGADYMEDVA